MSFQLFDRLAAFFRQANLYRKDNLFFDQTSLDRITAGGEFLNFGYQNSLLEQTNLQINRLERYKDFDQMDEVGEITLALDLYADESSLIDPELKHAIQIKAASKRVKDELEHFFYDTLLIDHQLRPMIRYLVKYGDFASEIIPTKNRNGVMSIRFMNIYNFTRVETRYGDLVGFFFQDQLISQPMFLHPWQVMHLRLTSFENIYHPYGRCCSAGTLISCPEGPIKIEDLKPGDEVYCFDQNQQLQKTKILNWCHSGKKKIIKIKTRHFAVRVSEEHPILISTEKGNNYKPAYQVAIGDKVVIPKIPDQSIPIEIPIQFDRVKLISKDKFEIGSRKLSAETGIARSSIRAFLDGRNTTLERASTICEAAGLTIDDIIEDLTIGAYGTEKIPNLPRIVDEDFAQFFGYMIGDGWLNKNYVELCLGEDPEINKYYVNLLERYAGSVTLRKGKNTKLEYVAATTSCKMLADTLRAMNFSGKAHEKHLPAWIFKASHKIQVALIQGLVDSDGCAYLDKGKYLRFWYGSTSKDLVIKLKSLLNQVGIKSGSISESKNPGYPDKNGIRGKARNKWQINWYQTKLPFEKEILTENVISICEDGEDETYDIQVEHPASNFVADGIVVHNSILDGARKHFKQLRLMEDAALIYRITRAPEKRVFTIPVGNIPTHEVPQYIELIARQFKKKRFFDPSTGDVNERWHPLIQEDDFWLPQRQDGNGPTVTTLPGAENLDDIKDIEYFKKKMVSALKIPFARVGIGDGTEGNDKSLSQVAPDFAKAIQYVQREVAIGLKKIAIVHLALAGYTEADMHDFDIHLTSASAIDELYRIETWASRANVIAQLNETGLFPKRWLLEHFTSLTDDEIKQMEKEVAETREKEMGLGLGMGMPMGGMPPPPPGDLGPPPGELAPLDAGMPPMGGPPGPPVPEGYDTELEARLLNELKNPPKKIISDTTQIYSNRGLWKSATNEELNSGFDHLLNSSELDGLTGPDNKVLIESIIDKTERDSARKETEHMLTYGNEEVNDEDDEITEKDLPG